MQVTVTGNLIEIVKDDGTELVINGANVVDEGGIRWEQYNTAPPILGSDPYTQPTPTKVARYKITLHFNDNRWETIWMGEVTNQPSWTDDLTGVNNATTYLSAALVASGGGGGGVSSVSADAPLSSSGGSAPTISIDTTGATAGQALVFDGADVVFDDVTAGAAGVEGSVQYYDGGALAGNGDFLYNPTNNTLILANGTDEGGIELGGNTLTHAEWEVGGGIGTAGQVLTSGGTGVSPTWEDPPAAAAAGSDTQLQFNTSNVLSASPDATFDDSTNTLGIGGGTGSGAGTLLLGGLTTGGGGIYAYGAAGLAMNAPTGVLSLTTNSLERLTIANDGEWLVSGAPGTTGQTIINAGANTPPVWGSVPVLTGNTLWVDAVNGNDGTGTAGRQDLPFAGPEAAVAAATSGDLVWVRPGAYDITTNIGKNGVNWHLEPGATITIMADVEASMFDDTSGPLVFTVSGSGVLVTDPMDLAGTLPCHIFNTSNAGTKIDFQVLDMKHGGTVIGAGVTYSNLINQLGGSITGTARDLLANENGSCYPVWWVDGPLSLNFRNIIGTNGTAASFPSVNNPTGEAYLRGDLIQSLNPGATALDQFVPDTPTADSAARVWIDVLQIKAANGINGDYAIQKTSGGNLYVQCQKVSGRISTYGAHGEFYWDTQKHQSQDAEDPTPVFELAGFKSYINIGKYTDGQNDEALLTVSAGTHFVNIDDMTRSNAGNGIHVTGGELRLTNSLVNTEVDSTSSPVLVEGGTLILAGSTLVAEATADSIEAPTAQTVISYGSYANKAVDGNVTVDGLLTVGAYVQ